MITFNELHTQNHKITELVNILETLFSDQALCGSEVTCELFFRFVDEVKGHLELSDKYLYAQLLVHKEQHVRNTANRFMGGSHEIKRIFSAYLSKWCQVKNKNLRVEDYDEFRADTKYIFEMILNRIQDETERLYPLVRYATNDLQFVPA
ncbi:MAG: hemerythrin domain-containing protein [Gammaproteobacteria bacterium]|nr:hemerythrin domain-containing protein [Gammaproteobacteria bacterium]MBU1653524.1 hemerythrin domain-containing protein [Gammaproteobacteria bacterium]MBU1962553.1 hemerythrin domain-containing protein [Gammaproteobacteria bacterium]